MFLNSYRIIPLPVIIWLWTMCLQLPLTAQKRDFPFNDPAIAGAHTGICIYDPSTGKFLEQYNAFKYFIPSSNVKIITLYAGLKLLGDSLTGLIIEENKDAIRISGTGDPTLLHPLFSSQPLYDFLRTQAKPIIIAKDSKFLSSGYGPGWSWEDYDEAFMPERTALPVYGNEVAIYFSNKKSSLLPKGFFDLTEKNKPEKKFGRATHSNKFHISQDVKKDTVVYVPFITSNDLLASLLGDTLKKTVVAEGETETNATDFSGQPYQIRSMPVDSLLIPMMYESDNFLAEQTLQMASFRRYGYMDEQKLIADLLQNELSELPQKPRWVDGSGLSRYNLFSPADMVFALNKMEKEFGWERVSKLFPAGGNGTLKGYYQGSRPYIYAKTGAMSNHTALSGYLVTLSGKRLIFSVIINHYPGKSTPVRRLIEKYLENLRKNL